MWWSFCLYLYILYPIRTLNFQVNEKHLTDLEERRQKCDERDTDNATGNCHEGEMDASGSKVDSPKYTPRSTPQKKYLSVHGALTNNSTVVKSLFQEKAEKKDDGLEKKLLQPTAKVGKKVYLLIRVYFYD